MFLDTSCFFVGEEKDTAIRIWDDSDLQGYVGFKDIENRCLVEMDTKYKIKMHDHIRDMGREIVEASGLQNRLWRGTENIDDLLQQSNGILEVRGIRILSDDCKDDDEDSSEISYYELRSWWNPELFSNLFMKICNRLYNRLNYRVIVARKLQLLDTEDSSMLEHFLMRVHAPNLRWLRWRNCCHPSLPYWIPMANLRVLQVFGSVLNELWQGQSQAPLQLRELVICSPLSKLPKNIWQLKNLQVFVLKESSLETLPDEFCRLQCLERFKLTDCSKIKSLPDCFGHLTKLEHIDLSRCSNLKRLPDTFGGLIRLKHLDLNSCSEVEISSETLGNIRRLEYIDLSHCGNIEVLPPQVERQPFLQKLLLEGTNIKEVPIAFEELSDSEEIVLESHLLERLPPSLGDLSNLKKVMFENCRELRCLQSIPLTQLTKLTVSKCGLCELSFSMVQEEVETLRQLGGQRRSSNVDSEVSFSQGVCPNLRHLRIVRCNDLVEVGTLPNTLRRLEFTNCSKLTNLEGLNGLSQLQMLNFNGCKAVELPNIETLVSLKELLAVGCEKLKSIGGLAQLPKLRILNLSYCHELEELPSVEHLESLEVLQAFECLKLKSIRGLMQLTELRELDVSGCSELEQLPGIEHCMSLEKLYAYNCPKLRWSDGVVEQLRQQVKEHMKSRGTWLCIESII